MRRGLSAGRVQSPALRMICEREEEIAAFVAREYWSIDAQGEAGEQKFPLKLVEYQGRKVEQFSFQNAAEAHAVERTLNEAAHGDLTVQHIDRKQRRRNPAPPFTTSTLQQEAARKLGFSAQKTMRTAQRLYEGVDTGDGAVGLITYMRTDSVNLAAEAVTEIRASIEKLYGKEGLAEEPRVYKTKSKNAQEAHEAIRPTIPSLVPADLESRMDADQHRLYALIWKRAIACQMSHAVYDTVAVDMLAGPDGAQRHVLRANGSTMVKPGFMAVYHEGRRRLGAGRSRPRAAADAGRRARQAPANPSRAAFHRAAAALFGSIAGEGARRARHRPAVDLCLDHLDTQGSRIRRDGQPPLPADRHRQDRQPVPDAATSTAGSNTASPRAWRIRSMRSRAARKTGCR